MSTQRHAGDDNIHILIADDDENILECYREAFGEADATDHMKALDALDAELFEPDTEILDAPKFDIVACSQGDDAISLAKEAANDGHPFDVVILDVRMPPGIDGVEAGSQIRALDPDVEIVFVTGYSDVKARGTRASCAAANEVALLQEAHFVHEAGRRCGEHR